MTVDLHALLRGTEPPVLLRQLNWRSILAGGQPRLMGHRRPVFGFKSSCWRPELDFVSSDSPHQSASQRIPSGGCALIGGSGLGVGFGMGGG